jgi:hypothetical protein
MLAGSVDLFVNSNKNSCDITSTAGPVGLFLIRKGCDIGFNFVNPGHAWQRNRYPRLHQRRANVVCIHARGMICSQHSCAGYDAKATQFTTEVPSRRRVKRVVSL